MLCSAGGQALIKFAIIITRKLRGGPAHAAVVGSATFGTISGGPVVNVLGTGTLTIPMMMKSGLIIYLFADPASKWYKYL